LSFVSSFKMPYNVPTLGEGADFKISFIWDPRSFSFQLFVLRFDNSGSCARRVLGIN